MKKDLSIFNRLKRYFYLIGALLVLSCAKDGGIGPQGEQGEQGERGEQGIKGIKGKDGNFLWSGLSDPIVSTGKKGDFYLNIKTSVLFGPKDDIGWGKGYSMKGEDGNNGQTGSVGAEILHGEDAPSADLGKVGDFYFDTKQVVFYGPKTKTTDFNGEVIYDWGSPISIRAEREGNVILNGITAEFKYDVSLIGNEVQANSQQGTLSLTNYLGQDENLDNIFMEFFYTIEHANVSYPLSNLERKWNKIGFETIDLEDIRINSAQSLKNVKLTLLVEKINRPNVLGYWYSCMLNATVPTPDYSTISGGFLRILVKIHRVSPVKIGKRNPTEKEIKRFLRIKD